MYIRILAGFLLGLMVGFSVAAEMGLWKSVEGTVPALADEQRKSDPEHDVVPAAANFAVEAREKAQAQILEQYQKELTLLRRDRDPIPGGPSDNR
jgi:hypothetical protein